MSKYIIKRILTIIIVMLLVGFLACWLVHFIPGDIAIQMLGEDATEEQLEALREELHLNSPIIVQYFYWLKGVFTGNFGWSMQYQMECGEIILSRLALTMQLGAVSLVLSLVLGIVLGTICAVKLNSWIDQVITVLANIGVAAPSFWIALLAVYFLAFKNDFFEISGYIPMSAGLLAHLRSVVLPIAILTMKPLASIVRQTRSAVLEAISQDYVRTAKAKGLSQKIVLYRHVLKNAMTPVITQIGLQVRNVIGGAVLVETVFNLPGMGRLIIGSVLSKDIYLVQASIVLIAFIVSVSSLVVDILYGYFNPRVKLGK